MKAKNDFDFYEIAMKELMKINCKRNIIPFPLMFNRFGVVFHFDKNNSIMLLKSLEKKRLVKIIPFKGVRILVCGNTRLPGWIKKSTRKQC